MTRIRDRIKALLSRRGALRTPEEFEALFRRFRDVLEANTRVLEVITEIGDTLGGDYLFDIQYVRRSYERLAASMEHALGNFDALTGRMNRRLHKRYVAISGEISQIMEEASPETADLVTWIERGGAERASGLGGKMANLAEVRQIPGVSVPEGFVLTTRAFDAYVRHNRIAERMGRSDLSGTMTPQELEEVRELLLHGELPQELERELERAGRKLAAKLDRETGVAVRSSAIDEDGVHAFAGQFRTILNVLPEPRELGKAYRKVVASLYSEDSSEYRRELGYDAAPREMAVGFLAMLRPVASGVLYTADPDGEREQMIISAAPGLGTSVVDGLTDSDRFIVSRDGSGSVVEQRIGRKERMTVVRDGGGVEEIATAEASRPEPCLSREQIAELARLGRMIEQRFGTPQDVEWAVDQSGRVVILQARSLPVRSAEQVPTVPQGAIALPSVIFKSPGTVVQKGSASGPVFLWKGPVPAHDVPLGAIVVMRNDSPYIVRAISRISAVITDTGGPTSHMASIAREFRLPTVVNTGNATALLREGEDVTIVAGDDGASVYRGRDGSIPALSALRPGAMDSLAEYRKKRQLLRFIAPLNLVDPLHDDFTPEACRTLHDLLRYMHEKALRRLMDGAGRGTMSAGAVKLDLPVPAGLTVIDIGGGLDSAGRPERVTAEQIRSVPLAALVRGMVHPGMWRSDPVPLSVNDFLTSMFRAPDVVATQVIPQGSNVAVVTADYVNLNIKFGYHYTILDSLCSDTPRYNHLYFRFAGGATDMTKRSRRLQFLGEVLRERGFNCSVRGDMIIARLAGIGRDDLEQRLEELGKLLSYTRQLDAMLPDDATVLSLARRFLQGDYGMSATARRG